MKEAAAPPRALQARLIHAVGEAGGTSPLTHLAGLAGPADLEFALADLGAADLLQLGPDGVVRFGSRGSALSAAAVGDRLRTQRYGLSIETHAVVESTNDLGLERAVAGARPGLVITGELQTSGRGRRGRAFDSRPGLGVWSTTLLDSPRDGAAAPRLSILAALAVAEAVEKLVGRRPGIKWPNDVRVDGRKVCGVLVEARSIGVGLHVVAGIGLNVHHRPEDFPAEIRDLATSLDVAAGRRLERSEVLAEVLAALERRVQEDRDGKLDLTAEFERWDEFRDRRVRLTGDETAEGVARGVDAAGRLRLEVSGTIRCVQGGEVSLRPD